MINYENIIIAVNRILKAETGRPIVPQNNTADQPKYPFATYSITSPYIAVAKRYIGDSLEEDVELVISLTWIAEDALEAASLAQRTAAALKHPSNRHILAEKNLVVVRIDGFKNRDTFLSIDTEFRWGYDLRLRTTNSDVKDTGLIEDVRINVT